jgi:hypothetical protein
MGGMRSSSGRPVGVLALGVILLGAAAAGARDPGDPIRLTWSEGDVAGQTPITDRDGRRIGVVVYHQHRQDDVLEATRVARFADGSSDEDTAVARVAGRLEAVSGRSIIRDRHGGAIVDLAIDVAAGRLRGFYTDGAGRQEVDETVALDPATYWGPLIFLVVKNFAANAEHDRVRFRTIAPTPQPRLLTMELVRQGRSRLARMGDEVAADRYLLRPTFGWAIDPVAQRFLPRTEFLVEPGSPPSLARYMGPRNYRGQEIVLE